MDKAVEEKFTPAAEQAVKAFPINVGKLELAWHSENITFRVTEAGTGEDYVLRLHRPGYHTLPELNSERNWTEALRASGLPTQIPLPTEAGENFIPVDIPGEQSRYVGMTNWVEGTLLSEHLETGVDEKERARCFSGLGALAAQMHNQASAWTPPKGFERHKLDSNGLMGEAPFWGRFWEHKGLSSDERHLLLGTRAKIQKSLKAYGKTASNYSMIHADLHAENVLLQDGTVTPIDFDDAGFGWHVYDLAVALLGEQSKPGAQEINAATLQGYAAHRTLSARDLAMLPTFFLIRSMALIGWLHQRPEHDGSDYFETIKTATCSTCEGFEPVF